MSKRKPSKGDKLPHRRDYVLNTAAFWSGVIILAGLMLILVQVSFEAFFVYVEKIRQFGSFYIGLIVLIIGAALMAVVFVTSRLGLNGAKQ